MEKDTTSASVLSAAPCEVSPVFSVACSGELCLDPLAGVCPLGRGAFFMICHPRMQYELKKMYTRNGLKA